MFPRVTDSPGYRFQMQSIQCNNRLDVVSVFVLGKDQCDHITTFDVRQRKVQHCNRKWPFSFEDYWRIKTYSIVLCFDLRVQRADADGRSQDVFIHIGQVMTVTDKLF